MAGGGGVARCETLRVASNVAVIGFELQRQVIREPWLATELTGRFEGRVVVIDEAVAAVWGELLAKADAAGKPMGAMDGFLAATAAAHQMTLVTRNEMDFAAAGIKTLNPWSE
jgi:predicted nucleic acid-binding protein